MYDNFTKTKIKINDRIKPFDIISEKTKMNSKSYNNIQKIKKYDVNNYDFLIKRNEKGLDTKYNIAVIDLKDDKDYNEVYENKSKIL